MRAAPWLVVTATAGAVAAGATGAVAQPGVTPLGASLTAAQEVPAPTGVPAGAAGTFTGSVTRGAAPRLAWRLTSSGLTGPAVAAHVHLGARGVAGPVAVPLCAPCAPGARGSARITPAVRAALLNGTAYVNVHTAANAPGEIRGQVGIRVRAALTTAQEVPRPAGARGARGVFTGLLVGRDLSFRLTFRNLTGAAQAAHVHLGRRRVAGPVAATLCGPCRSGVTGTVRLTRAAGNALRAGRTYVNVHTARNPAGEIRGQILIG